MKKNRLWIASLTLVLGVGIAGTDAKHSPFGGPSPAAPGQESQGQLRQFSGSPIDVDYQSANLRTVLRQLSEIGGINLVIDPSVPTAATVDLKLNQVPWDQVMDVVLRTSGLTYDLQGPVLRVLTREARTKELQDQALQKKASEAAPDLVTMRRKLNYANSEDVKRLLEQAFLVSERGSVDFEARTNMLIVKDTQRNIDEIQALLVELDKPEPQVEIEAKIIQTNRDTARALGVQWGFNGRVSPELGNTTGLAFPNRGTLGGRTVSQGNVTQGPNDPRATPLEQTGTAINLPVTGASSAVGLSLGAINGAFNVDVALTALEHEGKLEILSMPRVTTANNKAAEVTQGFQIPIQIVANNTVTVQFKDAALVLKVTPQITGANTVIMNILLENGIPDFSRAVNGNPSINTQRANTEVQVPDGVTTVIGGILQTQSTTANDRTPGISRIPLLGWLFRRDETRNESQELLIFITPRIIKG
ncbi:MAG TPA: type IV pilus secretin PilQ [Vicinamibacterales bacterium]|nr:type IV pilus secretin PilQ [Vicinamibacterales bacterium]